MPRVKLALAGDTMLGRTVAQRLATAPPVSPFAPEVVDVAHEADVFLLNLECAISARGRPWPDPFKRFFFRAPPVAVDVLCHLGVDCVTLANNHALDFGTDALLDTLDHLAAAASPRSAPAPTGGQLAGPRSWCAAAPADRNEIRWIAERFRRVCAAFGTEVVERDGRLVIEPRGPRPKRWEALACRRRQPASGCRGWSSPG